MIGLRKVLFAGALGLYAIGNAEAVRLSDTGQVLIYPYYSVARKADGSVHNTYLSVANTASDAKVMRVRIAEGRNHRAVLYFNLYLPPKGMWTAALVPGSGADPPRIITADKSCTQPAIGAQGEAFRIFDFTGPNTDAGGNDVERLAEGFVEIVEMATLRGAEAAATVPGADGTPTNCSLLNGLNVQFPSGLANPTGGLTGIATIINVAGGYDVAQRAIALADFTQGSIYRNMPDPGPSLDAADPISSFTLGTTIYRASWSPMTTGGKTVSAGALAVSSVLTARSLGNEVVLDKAVAANTEWVVTMPTKRFFVTDTSAVAPFSRPFQAAGACDAAQVGMRGRDAADESSGDAALCWSSMVLNFQNAEAHTQPGAASPVLGARNSSSISFGTSLQNGIAALNLGNGEIVSDASTRGLNLATGEVVQGPVTVRGLPAIGFSVTTYNNGQVTCGASVCKSTFAASVPHAGER